MTATQGYRLAGAGAGPVPGCLTPFVLRDASLHSGGALTSDIPPSSPPERPRNSGSPAVTGNWPLAITCTERQCCGFSRAIDSVSVVVHTPFPDLPTLFTTGRMSLLESPLSGAEGPVTVTSRVCVGLGAAAFSGQASAAPGSSGSGFHTCFWNCVLELCLHAHW